MLLNFASGFSFLLLIFVFVFPSFGSTNKGNEEIPDSANQIVIYRELLADQLKKEEKENLNTTLFFVLKELEKPGFPVLNFSEWTYLLLYTNNYDILLHTIQNMDSTNVRLYFSCADQGDLSAAIIICISRDSLQILTEINFSNLTPEEKRILKLMYHKYFAGQSDLHVFMDLSELSDATTSYAAFIESEIYPVSAASKFSWGFYFGLNYGVLTKNINKYFTAKTGVDFGFMFIRNFQYADVSAFYSSLDVNNTFTHRGVSWNDTYPTQYLSFRINYGICAVNRLDTRIIPFVGVGFGYISATSQDTLYEKLNLGYRSDFTAGIMGMGSVPIGSNPFGKHPSTFKYLGFTVKVMYNYLSFNKNYSDFSGSMIQASLAIYLLETRSLKRRR